jgi:23S rRNA (guanine2535-N1)-methyltransferase
MAYRFATESRDYTDYASGGVLYNAPGHPAFPVRLTSEIFQRCDSVRAAAGATGRSVIYDPVCGAAYHLSTLAYLHWDRIGEIVASDVDAEILTTAERNLSLLTVAGLDRRIREIEEMLAAYAKPSHAEALASAQRLRQRLLAFTQDREIPTHLFQADATDPAALRSGLGDARVDIVISDIPYGQHTAWRSTDPSDPIPTRPVWSMLEALRSCLATGAVVAIAADKGQKIEHAAYKRASRFQVGKRQVVLLQMDAG